MGVIDTILWPIRWVIEALLVGFHTLFAGIGIEGASGISWVLFLWRFRLSGHASDLLSPRQWVMPWSAIGRRDFSAQRLESHLVRKSVARLW